MERLLRAGCALLLTTSLAGCCYHQGGYDPMTGLSQSGRLEVSCPVIIDPICSVLGWINPFNYTRIDNHHCGLSPYGSPHQSCGSQSCNQCYGTPHGVPYRTPTYPQTGECCQSGRSVATPTYYSDPSYGEPSYGEPSYGTPTYVRCRTWLHADRCRFRHSLKVSNDPLNPTNNWPPCPKMLARAHNSTSTPQHTAIVVGPLQTNLVHPGQGTQTLRDARRQYWDSRSLLERMTLFRGRKEYVEKL